MFTLERCWVAWGALEEIYDMIYVIRTGLPSPTQRDYEGAIKLSPFIVQNVVYVGIAAP